MSPTPGLLWVNSGITSQEITDDKFNEWYSTVHVPDILKTSIRSAYRYKALEPVERPYLALYPVADTAWLGGEEYTSIPVKSDYFPGPSHDCFEYVRFDTRFYEQIDSFEKPGAKAGPANICLSAGLTPAVGTDADFDAWYKEEHYGTLSECTGYVRTRRYKLIKALRADNGPAVYLALHEFEGESLPLEQLAKTAETPWASKVMGSLVKSEIGAYRIFGKWGEVDHKF